MKTSYDYSAVNPEDIRGSRKMSSKRPMPKEQQAKRESAKEEADRLGKQHMAVAANKARANLARGQGQAEIEEKIKNIARKINPFDAARRALGGK
jgi:hypothetical protein